MPNDYYVSRYSGEEIDAALQRTAEGGALDTALNARLRVDSAQDLNYAQKVQGQRNLGVTWPCNPNLLDNWYFGNPVDQRVGYIVPKGVNYYKVDGLVPQGAIPETVRVDHIDHAGSAIFTYGDVLCYVPKDGGYVRGYTGNGYTVDRWFLSNIDGTILIQENGLNITLDKNCNYSQRLPISLSGKTVTFSILAENVVGPAYISIRKYNFEWFGDGSRIPIHDGLTKITYTIPAESTDNSMVCISNIDDVSQVSAKVKAAKLELGPTQTLAHQENGVWVLNEVPKYSRELLDCRMYHVKFGYADKYCILGSGVARDGTFVSITVPIPAEMRTYPAVILMGVIIIRHSDSVNQSCTVVALDDIGVSSILLKIKGSGLTPGDAYEAFLAPGNYLDVSCDL